MHSFILLQFLKADKHSHETVEDIVWSTIAYSAEIMETEQPLSLRNKNSNNKKQTKKPLTIFSD